MVIDVATADTVVQECHDEYGDEMRPVKEVNSVKPKFPKSLVWQYFDDINDGKHVFCLLCDSVDKKQMYKVPDGSTTSLREHLDLAHHPQFLDIKAAEKKTAEEKSEKKPKAKEGSIVDAFKKLVKVDPDGAEQKKFDKALLEMVGCNYLSFNLVDSKEFKAFVELLDRRMNVKHSTTYAKQMAEYSKEILEVCAWSAGRNHVAFLPCF